MRTWLSKRKKRQLKFKLRTKKAFKRANDIYEYADKRMK